MGDDPMTVFLSSVSMLLRNVLIKIYLVRFVFSDRYAIEVKAYIQQCEATSFYYCCGDCWGTPAAVDHLQLL